MTEDPRTLIFVVSDDPLVREVGEYGFPMGTEVELYTDAKDAREGMNDRSPDVVIVDLQTGNAGGFSLSREMQQTDRLAEVPVLILVERAQDGWLAMQSGAARYRLKPLPAPTLVQDALDLVSP